MTETLIDVLMPVYNSARTIRGSLESILAQSVTAFRAIVVDDGSTDDTAAIVASMAERDGRIDLVRRPNGGIVDALNEGLGHATARVIARFDGDDTSFPDRFAVQLAYLEAHPDCVAVGAATYHIDEGGNRLGHVVRRAPPEEANADWAPCLEPYMTHPFLMTYRDNLERAGGYRHVLNAEDSDLFWRLQETGRLHNLDDILGEYRLHNSSVSSASIVSGRICAVHSQLAALSAKRRRSGRPDLDFPAGTRPAYVAAGTLAAMVRLGSGPLDADEAAHLALASAAKLLDLASYRPFEPDLEDCRFIRDAFARHASRLVPENRLHLGRVIANAAARLAASGRVREASALASPALYGKIAARVAFRTLSSPRLRRIVRGRGANPRDFIK